MLELLSLDMCNESNVIIHMMIDLEQVQNRISRINNDDVRLVWTKWPAPKSTQLIERDTLGTDFIVLL